MGEYLSSLVGLHWARSALLLVARSLRAPLIGLTLCWLLLHIIHCAADYHCAPRAGLHIAVLLGALRRAVVWMCAQSCCWRRCTPLSCLWTPSQYWLCISPCCRLMCVLLIAPLISSLTPLQLGVRSSRHPASSPPRAAPDRWFARCSSDGTRRCLIQCWHGAGCRFALLAPLVVVSLVLHCTVTTVVDGMVGLELMLPRLSAESRGCTLLGLYQYHPYFLIGAEVSSVEK
jgi:hypothetical protein